MWCGSQWCTGSVLGRQSIYRIRANYFAKLRDGVFISLALLRLFRQLSVLLRCLLPCPFPLLQQPFPPMDRPRPSTSSAILKSKWPFCDQNVRSSACTLLFLLALLITQMSLIPDRINELSGRIGLSNLHISYIHIRRATNKAVDTRFITRTVCLTQRKENGTKRLPGGCSSN